jgi:hypothetical protein
MRPPEELTRRVLVPFDVREGIGLRAAAKRAGKSQTTIRNWCNQHGIGRRVGGGVWIVSKVALAMHLDGDADSLKAYLAGDRSSQAVKLYFERCEVPLPKNVGAKSATSTLAANCAGLT